MHALIGNSEIKLPVILSQKVAGENGKGIWQQVEKTKHTDLLVEVLWFFLDLVDGVAIKVKETTYKYEFSDN